MHEKK